MSAAQVFVTVTSWPWHDPGIARHLLPRGHYDSRAKRDMQIAALMHDVGTAARVADAASAPPARSAACGPVRPSPLEAPAAGTVARALSLSLLCDASPSRQADITPRQPPAGKLLTIFGEADENVDCMNRLTAVPSATTGLDGLEYEWNHDEFGFQKMWPCLTRSTARPDPIAFPIGPVWSPRVLRLPPRREWLPALTPDRYLPARVLDIMRLHSLREIPYGVYGNSTHPEERCPAAAPSLDEDPFRTKVTLAEARAFKQSLERPADRHRTEFVAYFQWFDARSKQQTDEIPLVDLDEVDEVIREYFPDGMLVW